MVRWYSELYLDEKAKQNIEKLKQEIEEENTLEGIYLICSPMNPKNLFDIIRAKDLIFPYYKDQEVLVFGVAHGKRSAFEILETMVLEAYRYTDNFDIRGYFREFTD